MLNTIKAGALIALALQVGLVWAQAKHQENGAPIPLEISKQVSDYISTRATASPLISRLQSELDQTHDLIEKIAQADVLRLTEEQRMFVSGQITRLNTLRPAFKLADKASEANAALANPQLNAQLNAQMDGPIMQPKIEARFAELQKNLEKLMATQGADFKAQLKVTLAFLDQINVARRQREGTPRPADPFLNGAFPKKLKNEPLIKKSPAYLSTLLEFESRQLAMQGNFGAVLDPPPVAGSCGYTAADLSQTADIQLTQEIRDLAKQLQYDPRQIYQYVYEQIKFEPYWGSMKGALATLVAQSGGPTDQASLLIALLRASNIPARYVRGVIHFNDDRGQRWFGVKTNVAAALVAETARYPTIATGPTGLDLAHVWVEACVPYANYRGSKADTSGYRWVPMDASFKELKYQDGIALNVPFNYTEYLSHRTDELPHEYYARQIDSAIKSMAPHFGNNTLEDVPYKGTLVKRRWDILPMSLPYQVIGYTQWDTTNPTPEAASLPESHRLELQIAMPAQGLVAYTLKLADIASSRVTVSFKGTTAAATGAMELIDYLRTFGKPIYEGARTCYSGQFVCVHITDYNGNVVGDAVVYAPTSWTDSAGGLHDVDLQTPSFSLIFESFPKVVPVIKVDGVEVRAGTIPLDYYSAPTTAVHLDLRLPEVSGTYASASLANEGTDRPLSVTDIAGVIGYGQQASDRYLTERIKKLQTHMQQVSNPKNDKDGTLGEFLYISGLKYARYVTDTFRFLGGLTGYSAEPGAFLGLSSSHTDVQYVFDLPQSISAVGLLVDVLSHGRSVKIDETTGNLTQALPHVRDFYWMSAHAGSAYEHYLWQETARLDAVSTIRGLQWAQDQGQALCRINDTTFEADWSACILDQTAQTKAAVRSYVAPGGYAIIPSRKTAYVATNNPRVWNGVVYAVNNLGNTGMLISGGLQGGYAFSAPIMPTNVFNYTQSSAYVPSSFYTTNSFLSTNNLQFLTPATAGVTNYTTISGDPVNMLTGNLYHNERDLVIKGRGGMPFIFERNYNSSQAKDGPLGYGWTHSFNHYLKFYGVETGRAKLGWVDGTGAERNYSTTSQTNGDITVGTTLENAPGWFQTVTRMADGRYRIREKNGLTYIFENVTNPASPPAAGSEPRARLLSITDRNGNTLTLAYNTGCGNLLCAVTDSLNRSLTFSYTGGRISEIKDWTNRRVQYNYDVTGNLQAVKNELAISGQQNPVSYEYYSDAQLNHAMKKYTLPRGNSMSFEYYLNGKVMRHTTNAGETTQFVYDDFRREARSINERGYTRSFFFNEYGSPSKIVKENGATLSYTYDTGTSANIYNRLSETDARGYSTQYQYDNQGNVIKTTLPSGNTIDYSAYNTYGQPGKIKDPRGNYRAVKFDAQGNAIQSWAFKAGIGAALDPVNYTANAAELIAWNINTYDTYGQLTSSKQVRNFATQEGPQISYLYDTNQLNITNIKRQGDQDGDGVIGANENELSPTMTYDALGRPTTYLSADWYLIQKNYDALDRPKRATDANNQWRDYKYDANGNLSAQSLTLNNQLLDRSAIVYDQSDRPIQQIDVAGNSTRTDYDATGNPIKITDADGYTISFDYDAANRAIRAYDAEGNAITREYDIAGRLRKSTDPNGNSTTYEYYDANQEGRLKTTTDALGRSTTVNYDANGNLTRITDPAGHSTQTYYDELNRATRSVGPVQIDRNPASPTNGQTIRSVTRYSYDNLSQLTQVQTGYTLDLTGQGGDTGLITQQQNKWDDYGRKLQQIDANGKTTRYAYDTNNNLIQSIDAKNQKTSYTYNYGHQLQKRTNHAQQNTSYTYNALGQILTAQNAEVTYTQSYDPAHRLQSVSDSRGNKQTRYRYSAAGRLVQINADDLPQINYGYDPTGRLTSIWDNSAAFVAYQYDAGGRLLQKWLGNGNSVENQWNPDNTLAQLKNRHYDLASASWQELSQHDYQYTNLGQKAQATEHIGPYAPAPETQSYAYDYYGNRSQRTAPNLDHRYTHDAANQLKEIRNALNGNALMGSLIYDANGNLIKKCTGTGTTQSSNDCNGPNVLNLTYDSDDYLSSAQSSTVTESYGYDPYGRRIRKTSNGQTTYYRYQGADILAEYQTSWSSPSAYYLQGAGSDEPIVRYTRQSNGSYRKTYLHQDGLGSVILATDESGTIQASQIFDAWGNKQTAQSIGTIATYGYTGREPDATGLIYYRARYYDPQIARFTQRDPIGLKGGLNQYAYVGNDPINMTDPSGMQAQSPLSFQSGIAAASYYSGSGGNPGSMNLLLADGSNYATRLCDACGGAWENFKEGWSGNSSVMNPSTIATIGSGLRSVSNSLLSMVPGSQLGAQSSAEFKQGNYATAAVLMLGGMLEVGATFATGGEAAVVRAGVTETTAVIGRVKDLQNLGAGEKSLLDRLPYQGNPKADWAQNSGVLRSEMNRGLPIRDASVGDNGGQFLNAERYLLKERGWTFDANTNFWNPPK